MRRPALVGILAAVLQFAPALCGGAAALDRAHLHISVGLSPNTLLYRYAIDKGFYAEEGLEVLPVQAGMLPGIQGLAAGSFDASQILGQGAGAILRGLPLKIVMVFDTRPLNWLYANRNIKSLRELRGKQIAVSSFGAALDQMTRELLAKNGLDPQRDVILRALEPTPTRLAALMTGAVDAAVLNQMDALIAKKNGLTELLFYGAELEFVAAGAVVAEKTIAERPDFLGRFLRGTLKSLYWFKSSEAEAVGRLARSMKISAREAAEVYQATRRTMSADGTIPRALQEKMIAQQRKTLKIEREVAPEQVYDFTPLRAAIKELGR
ncbi:MAG TPA: ABC transporter substrate-binding protein [Candidatus Binatia bacterium]